MSGSKVGTTVTLQTVDDDPPLAGIMDPSEYQGLPAATGAVVPEATTLIMINHLDVDADDEDESTEEEGRNVEEKHVFGDELTLCLHTF